jgi:hypothetical protein
MTETEDRQEPNRGKTMSHGPGALAQGNGHGLRDDPSVINLVTRARNGDKQAWDGIVERYAPLIWSICRRHRLDGRDAEDVQPDGSGYTWSASSATFAIRPHCRAGSHYHPAGMLPGIASHQSATTGHPADDVRREHSGHASRDRRRRAAASRAPGRAT